MMKLSDKCGGLDRITIKFRAALLALLVRSAMAPKFVEAQSLFTHGQGECSGLYMLKSLGAHGYEGWLRMKWFSRAE
jgi:hypothetical protein